MFGRAKKSIEGSRQEPRSIGVPYALATYLYPTLWETFFRELGFNVVVSSASTRRTVEQAGLISESEHCLPVKLFDAHLAELAHQVDLIFVPCILSMLSGHIACPKLSALPDCARAQVPDGIEILSVELNEAQVPLKDSMSKLGSRLGAERTAISQAIERALSSQCDAQQAAGRPPAPPNDLRFFVIGHPYNLHDTYLSGPIFQKLERLGVDAQPVSFLNRAVKAEPLHWDINSLIYNQLLVLDPEEWDGVIHLSSFNCGCDSIASTLYHDVLREKGLPVMTLVLDEHAGQAGVDTRLEAFVDSIKDQHEHAASSL